MHPRSAILVAAVAAALSTAGSAAPAKPPASLDLITQGLTRAVAAGQLDQATADGYMAIAKLAVSELPTIPRSGLVKSCPESRPPESPRRSARWAREFRESP